MFGREKMSLPAAIAVITFGLSVFVGAVLGIYWLLWLAYEHCVRAVFTAMPYASYWQFVGIMIVVSAITGAFRSSRN